MGEASATPQEGRRRAAASARFEPPRLPMLLTVLKGWALTVLSLGAYGFWAKADYRSYMWRHLSLGGERVEYDGKPSEALLRFLIEAAVAVPLLVGFLVATQFLEHAEPVIRFGALAGAAVVAVYLLQVRRYRLRQYLASHTLWRGVRCGLDGSAIVYGAVAIAGWLVVVLTLGLAYPWMRGRCWAHQIGRTRFGNRHFTFDPPGGAPFGAWLVVWLSVVGVLIGFAAVNQDGLLALMESWREGLPAEPGPPLTYLPLMGLILPAVFTVRYRVREFRWVASATQLGRIDLESSLPAGSLVIATLLHWILVLAGAGMALLWLHRSALEAAGSFEPVGILWPVWIGLLACAYLSVVNTLWLRREAIRTACRTLLIGELSPLQMIEQYERPVARRVRRTGAERAAELAADGV